MNKKAVGWLYRQLPELVAKGVIPPESAERIKTHYGPVADNTGTRTYLIVFGIIGVALVGLGIILILAHNWAELTRFNRLFISLAILVGAQVLAGMVLWFKRDSRVWTEASATFLLLMIGTSMALVGQTYHLVEDTDAFLLTWMLLSLPVIYLMNSAATAVLYLIGVTAWAVTGYFDTGKHLIWVLLGLALPYYWQLFRTDRYSNVTVILSWVFTLCFYICFTAVFSRHLDTLGMLVYSSLFAITYLLGVLGFDRDVPGWQKPFTAIGLAGTVGLTFILTFKSVWDHLRLSAYVVTPLESILTLTLLALVVGLTSNVTKRKGKASWRFSGIPLVVGAGYLLQSYDTSGLSATILVNAYLLWLSLDVISSGVHEQSLGIVNAGMLLLAALIVARFLDVNFSFVVRGLVFMLLGAGFLLANLVLVRRKARWQDDKE